MQNPARAGTTFSGGEVPIGRTFTLQNQGWSSSISQQPSQKTNTPRFTTATPGSQAAGNLVLNAAPVNTAITHGLQLGAPRQMASPASDKKTITLIAGATSWSQPKVTVKTNQPSSSHSGGSKNKTPTATGGPQHPFVVLGSASSKLLELTGNMPGKLVVSGSKTITSGSTARPVAIAVSLAPTTASTGSVVTKAGSMPTHPISGGLTQIPIPLEEYAQVGHVFCNTTDTYGMESNDGKQNVRFVSKENAPATSNSQSDQPSTVIHIAAKGKSPKPSNVFKSPTKVVTLPNTSAGTSTEAGMKVLTSECSVAGNPSLIRNLLTGGMVNALPVTTTSSKGAKQVTQLPKATNPASKLSDGSLVYPLHQGPQLTLGKGRYTPILCKISKPTDPADIPKSEPALTREQLLKKEIAKLIPHFRQESVKCIRQQSILNNLTFRVANRPPKANKENHLASSAQKNSLDTPNSTTQWKIVGGNLTKTGSSGKSQNNRPANKPGPSSSTPTDKIVPKAFSETCLKRVQMIMDDGRHPMSVMSQSQRMPTELDADFVQVTVKKHTTLVKKILDRSRTMTFSFDTEGHHEPPGMLVCDEVTQCLEVCVSTDSPQSDVQPDSPEVSNTTTHCVSAGNLQANGEVEFHFEEDELAELKEKYSYLFKEESEEQHLSELEEVEEMEMIFSDPFLKDWKEAFDKANREELADPCVKCEVKSEPEEDEADMTEPITVKEECGTDDKDNDDSSSDEDLTDQAGVKGLLSPAGDLGQEAISTVDELPRFDAVDGVSFVAGAEVDVRTAPPKRVHAYGCYLCNFCSLKKENLVEHWTSVHIPEKPYLCVICKQAAYSKSSSLVQHVLKCHPTFRGCVPIAFKNSLVYKNPLVMYISKDNSTSPQLVESLTNNELAPISEINSNGSLGVKTTTVLTCNTCQFSSDDLQEFRVHQYENHQRAYCYGCTMCRKSFQCRFDLQRHTQQVHEQVLKLDGDEDDRRKMTTIRFAGCSFNWSDVCEEIKNQTSSSYRCVRCSNGDSSVTLPSLKQMWEHLRDQHDWPSAVTCDTCSMEIIVVSSERKLLKTCCPSCLHSISLEPIISEVFASNKRLYICKVCDYKTHDRSSMYRHIKYSYIDFRPYVCPYCPFGSVEKSKVKKHVVSVHKNRKPMVRIHVDGICHMKAMIDRLMLTVCCKLSFCELDSVLGEDADLQASTKMSGKHEGPYDPALDASERRERKKAKGERSHHYQCTDCEFLAMSWTTYCRHRRQAHLDVSAPYSEYRTRKQHQIPKDAAYFQCNLCDYYSIDRSSMTRHIKYMHMHERPHACPHCGYKNVEKTKVRMHVATAHPDLLTYVNTDRKLLKDQSEQVKAFYKYIKHCNGEPLLKTLRTRPRSWGSRARRQRKQPSLMYDWLSDVKKEPEEEWEYGAEAADVGGTTVAMTYDSDGADVDVDGDGHHGDSHQGRRSEEDSEEEVEGPSPEGEVGEDPAPQGEEEGKEEGGDQDGEVDWVIETIEDLDSESDSEDDSSDGDEDMEMSPGDATRKRTRNADSDDDSDTDRPDKRLRADDDQHSHTDTIN